MENPFRPTAGATPPELIGRAGILDEFEYGLRLGSGAPGLLTVFTGVRGVGKTVMLGAAEDLALAAGWAVVSETATPGFVARIAEQMRLIDSELGQGRAARRITAFTIAGTGLTTALTPDEQVSWRGQASRLLNRLATHGTGLIITVDEIHAARREELTTLAADVQHLIREGLPIGMVFAGLPAAVSDLLNEGVATFLRRADRIDLHAAAVHDVATSLVATLAEGGWSLPAPQAQRAAEATGGYPFLIQLVGYFLWKEAEKGELDPEAVTRAIAAARRRNNRTVIEAALVSVSGRDRDFLEAMAAEADTVCRTADIGQRIGMRASAVGNYRSRLIDAGLIESAGYGKVRFTIPGMGEYLARR